MKFKPLSLKQEMQMQDFDFRGMKLAAVLIPADGFLKMIAVGHFDCSMASEFYWVHPDYRLTER